MAILFACPDCNTKHSASDRSAGKTARCRSCGITCIVPGEPMPPVRGGIEQFADLDREPVQSVQNAPPPKKNAVNDIPPRPPEKPRKRRQMNGWPMMIFGGMMMWYFLQMYDTTVWSSDGGVHNIGKLNTRLLGGIVGGFLFMGGVMIEVMKPSR